MRIGRSQVECVSYPKVSSTQKNSITKKEAKKSMISCSKNALHFFEIARGNFSLNETSNAANR
jgi:hypothetical protein